MNRKLAREECYKLIFTYLFTGERDDAAIAELECNAEIDGKDMEYIIRTYTNATAHYAEIAEIITKYSKGFAIERIFRPDLSGIILAIAEMKYDQSIPLKVSINEVIDIVKRYSVAKSNSFVNGILASYYRALTATEKEVLPQTSEALTATEKEVLPQTNEALTATEKEVLPQTSVAMTVIEKEVLPQTSEAMTVIEKEVLPQTSEAMTVIEKEV